MRFFSFTHIYRFPDREELLEAQDYQGVVKIIVLSIANNKEITT